MSVVINEFEVISDPVTPSTPAATAPDGGEPEPDLRALQAWLARQTWCEERLHAD